MPTANPSRHPTPARSIRGARLGSKDSSNADWRCTGCDKLLGVRREGRMHIRFARGHEYLAGFPVSATCRSCGTLNRATSAAD